jgi:uncharacterized protein YqeY
MMLEDQIKADLHASTMASSVVCRDTLRMLISELNYKRIEVQRDLTDVDVIAVVQKEVKKRNEAIISWEAANRLDSANKEREELNILQVYLPVQMTEEEIKSELIKMDLPKDFAQAMKIASPAFRGKAGGKLVAELVKQCVI